MEKIEFEKIGLEISLEELIEIQSNLAKTLDFWQYEFKQTIEIKCLFDSLREINKDLYNFLEEAEGMKQLCDCLNDS